MSIYKELSYDNYIEQVKSIRFCILGPNEISKMSVAEITKTDSYLGTEPIINGLFDPRMGVLDHNKFCHTCEQKNTFCPGHFGHINLAKLLVVRILKATTAPWSIYRHLGFL